MLDVLDPDKPEPDPPPPQPTMNRQARKIAPRDFNRNDIPKYPIFSVSDIYSLQNKEISSKNLTLLPEYIPIF
jgi:hypothetical protein